jgi:hypothetical protein
MAVFGVLEFFFSFLWGGLMLSLGKGDMALEYQARTSFRIWWIEYIKFSLWWSH